MIRIDTAERRRRLAARHHLAAPPQSVETPLHSVADDLAGIHATDPASVYLGARARIPGLTREDVTKALYDDRTVLKVLGMRRTMFVVLARHPAFSDVARDGARRVTRLMLIALSVVVLACGSGSAADPTETPGTMDDAIAALVLNGVAIHNLVGGDSGCAAQDLHDNAVRLEVSVGTMSSTRAIYLMRWRRQSDFDAAADTFASCITDFSEQTGALAIDQVANAPWRAFGADWPDPLRRAVADALDSVGSQ